MPQMAPMMWQMIYLFTLILLLVSISKNFFLLINKKISFDPNKGSINKNMNWKW